MGGRFPGAPSYVLSSLCNNLCQERFLKWPRLSIYFPYYWAEMVMAKMVMSRNGSGPKMNSHSDEFILKFASVSEFHKTDDRKMRTPFLFALIAMQRYVAKKALTERQLQGMPRCAAGRFIETFHCIAKRCKTFQSAPTMQRTPAATDRSLKHNPGRFAPNHLGPNI